MDERPDLHDRPYGVWWSTNDEVVVARPSVVRAIGVEAYRRAGAATDVAEFFVDMALDKAIVGDQARGQLVGWPGLAARVAKGEVSFDPPITILHETAGTAVVDDVANARLLVCRAAMNLAIDKARTTGIACVTARCTPVILAAHVRQATDAGMVGMVMTQSYPLVAPLGGRGPMLGNGPIAFGVPAGDRDPVILDMSMTESSASGVRLAASQGQAVAEGIILDQHGEPTTDAREFPDDRGAGQHAKGSLVPLGGGHKGYGLIFVISLLSAVLSDTHFPWEVEELAGSAPVRPDDHYGALFVAIRPDAFGDPERFAQRVDQYLDDVTSSPRRDGVDEILYPGQKSQRLRRARYDADEFLLTRTQYAAVVETAEQLGLGHLLEA